MGLRRDVSAVVLGVGLIASAAACGERRILPPVTTDPEPGQPAQVGDATVLGLAPLFGTADGWFERDGLREVSLIARDDGSRCLILPGDLGACSHGRFFDPPTETPFAFPLGATGDAPGAASPTCIAWWASLDVVELRVSPEGMREHRLLPVARSGEAIGVQVFSACWTPSIDPSSPTVAMTEDGAVLTVPGF